VIPPSHGAMAQLHDTDAGGEQRFRSVSA
jgi:hypothetical protein